MRSLAALVVLGSVLPDAFGANCFEHNYCNGHGACVVSTSTCNCYEGWGADTDVAVVKAADCSLRTCPSGRAWADVPSGDTTAHALAECSNKGVCNSGTGTCACFPGFEGDACQRMVCPNDCSGHGRCMNLREMATLGEALPLSNTTWTYEGDETSTTWDEDMLYGCVCDSSWKVGLGNGERQEPEWFGHDCSRRHCPSGDDPRTLSKDETNCFNVTAEGGFGVGANGNLCHVDCSNRGQCNYYTGECKCFTGYYGDNCGSMSALAK
mmetsp:Transcript_15259/g.40285  ORF Transcript_15259/g.40285 Transcript_15259/m.40285 type:complete len:267 (-) Transcript_15259:20-820(-)